MLFEQFDVPFCIFVAIAHQVDLLLEAVLHTTQKALVAICQFKRGAFKFYDSLLHAIIALLFPSRELLQKVDHLNDSRN